MEKEKLGKPAPFCAAVASRGARGRCPVRCAVLSVRGPYNCEQTGIQATDRMDEERTSETAREGEGERGRGAPGFSKQLPPCSMELPPTLGLSEWHAIKLVHGCEARMRGTYCPDERRLRRLPMEMALHAFLLLLHPLYRHARKVLRNQRFSNYGHLG